MSTRDEILAALTEAPAGLTSKELAPKCPAAECDEMIVGRTIATLRGEGLIHPGTELRDGGTIWIFGKPPEVKREPYISLAGGDHRQASSTSEAANAIARMRGGAAAAPRKTSPAPAAPAFSQEETMKKDKEPSVAERVVAALTEHGPLAIEALAGKAKTTKNTLYTMLGTLQKKHGLQKLERGVYGLKGQAAPAKAPARDALALGADRGRKAAPPNLRSAPKNGSPYAAAIADLQGKRSDLEAEIEKIDHAIEAIEALA